jgi:hypothetical protein
MSDGPTNAARSLNWPECCAFMQLFRAFKLAIHPAKLLLAFCGVLATYAVGRTLDGIWPEASTPIVATTGNVSELDFYLRGGGRGGTKDWIKAMESDEGTQRVGAFKLLMGSGRTSVNHVASSVVALSPTGILVGVGNGLRALMWLVALHPWYALIFLVISFLIWALCGGGLCRIAALHATRDERISVGDAVRFARSRLGSFFVAPLMPLGIVVFFGLLLFLGGLVGAIPAVGEVLVGLLFFLALLAGFALAFVILGALGGYSMMYPTIAVEGSDAFDALSRTFSYVYQRPWRTVFYYLVSLAYGAVCVLFVKFFVRLMLWSTHFFVALSMNWGQAYTADGAAEAPKLDTLWQTPSLSGETAFFGGFGESVQPTGLSWFGQLLIKVWIYLVYGGVAAFLISLFYSSSTLIYLVLRREVDATDLEDVFLEDDSGEVSAPAPAASTPQPTAGGASLPIIGQNS